MNLKIIEDEKTKFVFEIDEGHAFCNALKDELWNDDHVKVAAYRRDHPLINVSRFQIETDTKLSPKACLQNAIQRLSTKNRDMKKDLKKVLK